jgi:hypothetical protein
LVGGRLAPSFASAPRLGSPPTAPPPVGADSLVLVSFETTLRSSKYSVSVVVVVSKLIWTVTATR